MIRTTCGIPTFIPTDILGFDIETVDYNADEVPSRLRLMQALPSTPVHTDPCTDCHPDTRSNSRPHLKEEASRQPEHASQKHLDPNY
jgi:hypothetical protein